MAAVPVPVALPSPEEVLSNKLREYITSGPRASDTTTSQIKAVIAAANSTQTGLAHLEAILSTPVSCTYDWAESAPGTGNISLGVVGTRFDAKFPSAQKSCTGESYYPQKLAGPYQNLSFTVYYDDARALAGSLIASMGTYQGGNWVCDLWSPSSGDQTGKPAGRIVIPKPPFTSVISQNDTVVFV